MKPATAKLLLWRLGPAVAIVLLALAVWLLWPERGSAGEESYSADALWQPVSDDSLELIDLKGSIWNSGYKLATLKIYNGSDLRIKEMTVRVVVKAENGKTAADRSFKVSSSYWLVKPKEAVTHVLDVGVELERGHEWEARVESALGRKES
ncbi:MAG: hypothetical protein ACYTFD_19065 [Planctomycetota bacterium]|jgi:hypothetical protein